jgi:vacuolar protein sorting-associated protein 16
MDQPQEASSMYILESFSTDDISKKRVLLKHARDLLSTKKECYLDTKLIQDQFDLVNDQDNFDSTSSERMYSNTSISDSIFNAILDNKEKKALAIKSKYSVPDKRYWWLAIKALAKGEYWNELEEFSKSKKSPIGYGPFVEVCLSRNNTQEATKYVTKVTDVRQKVEYCVQLAMWKEAMESAFQAKDQKLLLLVANRSKDQQVKSAVQNLLKKL